MRKGFGSFVALAVLAGGLVVAPVEVASAQSLLDRLFKTPRYQERRRFLQNELKREKARKFARVRVSGPSYYKYKVEKPVWVSFENLADVEPKVIVEGDQENASAPVEPARPLTAFELSRDVLKTYKLKTFREVASVMNPHYLANPSFLWVSDGTVNGRAKKVIATLEQADKYGLSPADYRVRLPDLDGAAANSADPKAQKKALIAFEMELTASALTYVLDAQRGRIDPNRISGYHDLPRNKVDLVGAVRLLASAGRPDAYLEGRHPNSSEFKMFVKTLAKLRAEDAMDDVVHIAPGTFLKPGTTNPEVANVIAAIRKAGSATLMSDHAVFLDAYADDPKYTPEAVALVRGFQREKNLGADGIVGKKTIRALVPLSNSDKIRKLELAMERRRWLPRHLGSRHVIINQPAYTATYNHAGEEPFSMRVVVGKKSNQTSFFHDEIETVEFNPYWGVPRSIIVNEMVPKLYSDPSYLDRLGYEVSTVSGRRVSSSSVNWSAVASKQQSINVRQPPGSRNALGRLKILFPNKHAIYMHDTPAKKLFERETRAFSHGCVRLHDPRGMAAKVLGTTVEYIDSRIAGGRNEADPVDANIPVYVAYFTAWPTDDGGIGYYDDMYDRDLRLTKANEATDAVRQSAG